MLLHHRRFLLRHVEREARTRGQQAAQEVLRVAREVAAEPAEHALPALAVTAARLGAVREALVAHGDARATIDGLEAVGDHRLVVPVPRRAPRVHDETRRVNLAELALDRERVPIGADAGAAPATTGTHVGRVLGDVVLLRRSPPLGHLVARDGAEDAVDGGGDLDGREDQATRDVGHRARRGIRARLAHCSFSRCLLRFARLVCQKPR